MRWRYGSLLLCVGALALAPARATAEGLGLRDKLKARNAEGMIDDAMKESVRGHQAKASLDLRKAEIVIDELALKYGRNQADVRRLYGMLADARARVRGSAQPTTQGSASAGKQQATAPGSQGGGSTAPPAKEGVGSSESQEAASPGASQGREASGSSRAASGRGAGSARRGGGSRSSGPPADPRAARMAQMGGVHAKQIETTINDALKHSDLAEQVTLENQKTNNLRMVQDDLRLAREKIAQLQGQAGASDPEVQRLSKRLEEARSQIWAKHGARLEAMLASVKAPQNVYKGSDRAEWEGRIRKLWTTLRPNDQFLGIRFDQANWVKGHATTTSEESVTMNAKLITKTYTPEESLRVSVVVKASDTLATIYNVYCRRDLTNGETSLGFNSDGGIHFAAEMLLANFK